MFQDISGPSTHLSDSRVNQLLGCVLSVLFRIFTVWSSQYMRQTFASLFKRIGDWSAASQRKDSRYWCRVNCNGFSRVENERRVFESLVSPGCNQISRLQKASSAEPSTGNASEALKVMHSDTRRIQVPIS